MTMDPFLGPLQGPWKGPVQVRHLAFELPHLPVNTQLSGNIFDISSLFCFLIPNSGPTLSPSPLEVFPDTQSLDGFPPIGIELASSILCHNLQLSLSQQPWLHPKFTPSPFFQGPQIFQVRAHVHHVAHSLAYRRWSKNIWWINKQMEQWQEGGGIYFSDFLRKNSLLDRAT